MNHDIVHDREVIDGLENGEFSWAEFSEKFWDECFGLSIVKDGLIVFLIKYELKSLIVDEFFYFLNKLFWFGAVNFETQLEVLIVEDSNVGLRIIVEYFDYSGWVDKILFKEGRELGWISEDILVLCELSQGSHYVKIYIWRSF